MKRIRKAAKIFHTFKEQEEADFKYWKRVKPGKRVEALEEMRLNYLRMKYG